MAPMLRRSSPLILLLFAACQDPARENSLAPRAPVVEASATAESSPDAGAPIVVALMDPNFVTEKVTGEAHAMGTHVGYAAYTTPKVNGDAARKAFDAATLEIERIENVMDDVEARHRHFEGERGGR